MRHHSVVFALCLLLIAAAVQHAQAKAGFYRVTPATKRQSPFAIAVTTHRFSGTVQFAVRVQARYGSILSPFHTAFVNDYGKGIKFDRWQTPNAAPQSSRALTSSSNRGGLHYEFSVPNSRLSSTLFTYDNEGYTIDHGKVRMMPSAEFCWFRCRDFVHRRG